VTRKLLAGSLLGLAAALIVLLLAWAELLDLAELQAYDWRIRRVAASASVHPDVALVEINDLSLRDLAPVFGRWPWPRAALAMVVDFLSRAPARVIAIDLTFLEPDNRLLFRVGDGTMTGDESDASLASSVETAGTVVLAADAVYHGTADGNQPSNIDQWSVPPYKLGPAIEARPLITPPYAALTKAAAALGHNLMILDADGPARRMAPFIRVGDRYIPALGVAAALRAMNVRPEEVSFDGQRIHIRDRTIPLVPTSVPDLDDEHRRHDMLTMLINYRAPRLTKGERSYKFYEIRHVIASEDQLQTGQTPIVDPAVFKDKIVFVGLGASGLVDVFTTPFGDVMPGMQLHATMADNILSDRFIRRRPAPDGLRIVTTIGFAIAVALTATTLPYAAAAACALLVAGGWTLVSLQVFRGGLWLNMVQPLAASGLALFAGTAYQYFVEGAEKRAVKKLFGRYVSKDVFHQLMEHPELAELGGNRRQMTVLFCDIRGFTSITESGNAEALVAQLNEYFSRMVDIVFRHHGTVDKFVGDLVMALFGAPLDDRQHAEHAVAAAVDMVAGLRELNGKWAAEGRPQLDIGIGVNSGEMIAGNIGSTSIMSYTVIGDNVNLGSRLESLNKDYGTRIIVSDATRSLLPGTYEMRPLGDVVVKGKTRPVAIFEVVVSSPLHAAPQDITQ
jgi:adenylate cyclase